MPLWLWRLLWPLRARLHPGKGVGSCFPDFTMKDAAGRAASLYDGVPGRFTALWLTNFCADCRARIPLLEELIEESGGRLRVLAVSILPVDDPLPLATAKSCSFPVLLDGEDVVGSKLGLPHPPGTCPLKNLHILDGTGKVLFQHHLSAVTPEALRSAWRSLAAPAP